MNDDENILKQVRISSRSTELGFMAEILDQFVYL
jgi:hypothetical protein